MENQNQKFKEYKHSDIKSLEVIRITTLFKISSGSLDNKRVLLYQLRFFEYKDGIVDKMMNDREKFPKLRSEFILNRIGFIANQEEKSFSLIYECPENGVVLDFSDFSSKADSSKSETEKMFLLEKILFIIFKIKKRAKDYQIGCIDPSLFFFNFASGKPILLVDFALGNFYTNTKDPFLKLILGILNFQENKANDILMLCLLIASLFTSDASKKNKGGGRYITLVKKQFMYMRDEDNTPNPFECVSDEHLRHFLEKYSKTTDFAEFYFAFKQICDKGQINVPCKQCQVKVGKLNDICHENLCEDCVKDHHCLNTFYYNLDNYAGVIKSSKVNITNQREYFNTLPNFVKFNSLIAQENTIDYFEEMRKKYFLIKTDIIKKDDLITNLKSLYLRIAREKLEDNMSTLENIIKSDNDELKKELATLLSTTEQNLYEIKSTMQEINNKSNLMPILSEIATIAGSYLKIAKTFRKSILSPQYKDYNDRIFKKIPELSQDNFTVRPLLIEGDITKQFCPPNLFVPISQTEKIEVFDVFSGQSSIREVKFPDDYELSFFPSKCRWETFTNYIILQGGVHHTTGMDLNSTLILNSSNLDKMCVSIGENMLHARSEHSTCTYNKYFIVSAGGKSNDTCEVYSILRNKSLQLPALNSTRSNGTLYVHNKYMLYIFGGNINEKEFNPTIECLDPSLISFENEDNVLQKGWRVMNMELGLNLKNFATITKLNDENKIIIVGGSRMLKEENESFSKRSIYERCFELNLKTLVWKEVNKMKGVQMNFYQNRFYKTVDKFCLVGTFGEENKLITFDINDEVFIE